MYLDRTQLLSNKSFQLTKLPVTALAGPTAVQDNCEGATRLTITVAKPRFGRLLTGYQVEVP